MVYDNDTSLLLCLVRSALWQTPPDLSAIPAPDAAAWQRVFRMANEQTVAALACRGLDFLPESLLPPEDLILRWVAVADRIERRNRTVNAVLRELSAAFAAEGLFPVVLKGQASAQCYCQPLLRQSGDIDLYFPHDGDARRAETWVRRHGAHIEREADGSMFYTWRGVKVEHHPRLIDLYHPRLQRMLRRAEAQWGFAERSIAGEGFGVKVPAPALEMLMLSSHILKHAMGRGIGLRQLCDVAVACQSIPSASYGEAFHRLCRATHTVRWQRLLHACLTDDLHLSPADLPFAGAAASSAPLMRIVLSGGNFGQHGAAPAPGARPWRRKMRTAAAFLRNLGFSLRYAPAEVFWMLAQLCRGQRIIGGPR